MLQTDASIKGLGACFLQEDKPVYFESKALTDSQRGYVATELELTCSGLGNGEIPPLFISQSFHLRN